jgi:hypothetical protein
VLELDQEDTATYPATLTKFNISEAAKGFAGAVHYSAVFNTVHDAATQATILSQVTTLMATRGVTIAASDTCVLFEGDSITENGYIVGPVDQYPYKSVTTFPVVAPALDVAVHSNVIADAVTRATATDLFFSGSQTYKALVVFIGGNDVQNGTAPATAYAALKSYCAARKAAAPALKIIVCTSPVRDVVGFEANRLTWNSLINGGDTSYDAVADFGGDTFLGDPAQASFGGANDLF